MSNHVEEHVSLLQAIVEGRSEDAANISREHILSFEQMVRAAL
jgi:DNA-binding FadR family transcriptional regulator